MLRMLSLAVLGSSSMALAQVPPPAPAEPVEKVAAPSEPAPPAEEVAPEEPKMKRVCRSVEVVGSAVGRTVCTMKPIRAPRPKG